MNNRGFTLIEVLAAIVILGVVLMIAIPSVTSVNDSSKYKQLKKDAEMFKSLVESKITKDTSIEIPAGQKACFTLRGIEDGGLSGDYDENSYVEVSNCSFTSDERYVCSNYVAKLVYSNHKGGYSNGSYIVANVKLGTVCNGQDWCLCG